MQIGRNLPPRHGDRASNYCTRNVLHRGCETGRTNVYIATAAVKTRSIQVDFTPLYSSAPKLYNRGDLEISYDER
jgi:hypothetical protein